MFTDCEMGSSGTGRGINESGSYWISKSELLAAYIIFSYVPLPSGDLQKFTCFFRVFFVISSELSAFLSVSLVSS